MSELLECLQPSKGPPGTSTDPQYIGGIEVSWGERQLGKRCLTRLLSRDDSEKQPINHAIEESERFYSIHIF